MIIKNIIVFLLLVSSLFANRLDNINSRGFIKVGVYYDYAPFGYVNSKNKLVGFEIDLAKEIAKQMGVKARFFQINSENKLNRLNKDRIDIILGATTHSNFADKYIDFTNPYFYNGQAFLARKNFRFKSNISFLGKKIAFAKGSVYGANIKKLIPKVKLVEVNSYDEALKKLNRGLVDIVTSNYVWSRVVESKSGGELKIVGEMISLRPYAIGLKENQSDLLDKLNLSLKSVIIDGRYEKIYQKWFKTKPYKFPNRYLE